MSKWSFHSNSIKKIDLELNQIESYIRRYEREKRYHLVHKWQSKKHALLEKRTKHTMALLHGWNNAAKKDKEERE